MLPFIAKLFLALLWTIICIIGGWFLFCEKGNDDLQSTSANDFFRIAVDELPPSSKSLKKGNEPSTSSSFEEKLIRLGEMAHMTDKIDVVVSCAFGFGKDPQRGKAMTDAVSYSKSWRESALKIEDLHLVLISDMLSNDQIQEISHERLEIVQLDPSSSEMVKESSHLSVNDFVYIAAQTWLLKNSDRLRYVLVTDLHDVVFSDNPFHYMMSVDVHFSSHLLFVQDETKNIPGAFGWLELVWTRCGMVRQEMPRGAVFFSSGLVGGHVEVFFPFLRKYCDELLQMPPKKNCNMAVLQKMMTRDYNTLVVHGWPFHNIFKSTVADSFSIIKHKQLKL